MIFAMMVLRMLFTRYGAVRFLKKFGGKNHVLGISWLCSSWILGIMAKVNIAAMRILVLMVIGVCSRCASIKWVEKATGEEDHNECGHNDGKQNSMVSIKI